MPTTHPGGDPRHTFLKPPEVIARYRCRGRRYAARSPVRRGGILALTWLLSRQNLGLLLDHGMLTAEVDNSTTSTWGNTVGNATYVWRTALGIRQDGSLVFAYGGASDATGYVHQCYNNQASGTPTPVAVSAGAIRVGISAALAEGGALSGTVTDSDGTHHGLANVIVSVSSASTGASASVTTAADGSYTMASLPSDADYQVCFYASGATGGASDTLGYLDQRYNAQPTTGTPTPVTVTAASTTAGINAALAVGGAVSGTVTDAGGTHHGLAGVQVSVSSASTLASGFATTAADGSYTVNALPPAADYQVCFTASGATGGTSDALGYVDQCYSNQPTSGTPTPVSVTAGGTTTGTGAALAAAGAVSGTVTDAGGTHHGLAGVQVSVSSASTGATGFATTAADGSYSVTGLAAAADYTVCFAATGGASDALGYVDQCYNNQPTSGTPTPVSVTAGGTTTGTNAALAGAVSGTVTDGAGTHQPLAGVQVSVSSASTGASGGALTAVDGSYTVTGLAAAADYTVCFAATGATGGASDTLGYADQCYNNQPTSGTPTPVSVNADATTTGTGDALAENP
jgi:hypothetical protein